MNQPAAWPAEAARPLTDLAPFSEIVGDAVVVGLGESAHGARELFTVKHRLTRILVERLGFRAVAWEEDWTLGRRLDEYVRGGDGDPRDLLADAIIVWRTEEILDVLTWMRAFNDANPTDQVRFVGVDVLSSRGDGTISDARHAYEQAADDDARQQAKVVLASHTFHQCPPRDRFAYRDQQMAENTIWWHERTGAKTVYWAHNAHAANDTTRMSTGAHLRARFGTRYVAVATTFDHGSVNVGLRTPAPQSVAPPPGYFTDAAFGDTDFMVDLRDGGWPAEPATIRAIGPSYDPTAPGDFTMSGGALGDWFDAIVHTGTVTPSRMLDTGQRSTR
jgi:erythromycin esterase